MKKKIDTLREYAMNEDWHSAIKLAASFPRLGNEKMAITRAKEALVRPDFQIQLGRNPDLLLAEGIKALRNKYSF